MKIHLTTQGRQVREVRNDLQLTAMECHANWKKLVHKLQEDSPEASDQQWFGWEICNTCMLALVQGLGHV